MSNFSHLISYFQQLAERHVSIRHTDSEKHFFRMEIDEVLAGLNRTDVNYPMLILEGYSYSFTDNKSDNLLKDRSGAFILLGHIADATDYDAIHQVWDTLEQIGDDILMKIKADKRNPLTPVIRNFDFSTVEVSLIMNELGNSAGLRYRYTISSPVPNDADTEKWID